LLELPGVYERYVSSESTSQLIAVLRYRCGQTGASVSLLPDFAQPYRLLASELIEDYFWLFVDSCERSRFEVEFAALEEDGHSIVLKASEASRIGFDAFNHTIKSLSSRIGDTVF